MPYQAKFGSGTIQLTLISLCGWLMAGIHSPRYGTDTIYIIVSFILIIWDILNKYYFTLINVEFKISMWILLQKVINNDISILNSSFFFFKVIFKMTTNHIKKISGVKFKIILKFSIHLQL